MGLKRNPPPRWWPERGEKEKGVTNLVGESHPPAEQEPGKEEDYSDHREGDVHDRTGKLEGLGDGKGDGGAPITHVLGSIDGSFTPIVTCFSVGKLGQFFRRQGVLDGGKLGFIDHDASGCEVSVRRYLQVVSYRQAFIGHGGPSKSNRGLDGGVLPGLGRLGDGGWCRFHRES